MKIPSKRSLLLLLTALVLTIAVGGFWFLDRPGHQPQERVEHAAPRPSPGLRIAESERPQRLPSMVVRNQSGQHQVPPAVSPLSEALAPGSGLAFQERLAIIHRTERALSRTEVQALLDFIESSEALPDISASARRALENDILNLLQRQSAHTSLVRETLMRWTRDESLPAIKRDYALQHLATLEEADERNDNAQHWQTIEQGPPELAATAMLHLLANERHGGLSEAERVHLAKAAMQLLTDSQEDPPTLATALQVCGRLQVQEVRAQALRIASDLEAPFPLRIAAIATLGDLEPSEEVFTLLQTLEKGREKRLRLPAISALQRLNDLEPS